MISSLNKNKTPYAIYLIIFLEIIFLVYLSFTTKNVSNYIFSLIIIIFITFPLGFSISLFLFREKTLSELIMLSFCIGLPLSAGVWGILTYCHNQIQPIKFLLTTFFISIMLTLGEKLKYKKIFHQKNVKSEEIYFPIIVFLIGFIVHALMQANNNVSFDCDPQSTVYLETLMKYQGYPAINPLIVGEKVNIAHPPTFNTIVVLLSLIKNSLLHKECMAVTVVCGSYFVLAVYLLAYYLSGKNHVIGFFAGILVLNRAYLTTYNDGNCPELFAFLCITVFILFLFHSFDESLKLKSLFLACVGGYIFAQAALSQTEIFLWYSLSLGLFLLTFHISKNICYKKDFISLFTLLCVCGICILPWFLNFLRNLSGGGLWQVFEKEATELILSLTYWHSYTILCLSLLGIILLVMERKKIGIYVVTHIFMMFFLIIHWKFLKFMEFDWFRLTPMQGVHLGARASFTTPIRFFWTYTIPWYSLTIAFPIAAAYCLGFIFIYMQKIKHFQLRIINGSFLIIMIGLSSFLYYEYKTYFRYPEWLLKSDYETLLWFHENTSYENTLILNAPESIKLPNGVQFFCSYWVPAVSERRAVNARGLGGDHIPNIPESTKAEIKNLGEAFYNISAPGVYETLKKNGVTHIFVSALLASQLIEKYLKIPFLELAHYQEVVNHGTAFIFKVK